MSSFLEGVPFSVSAIEGQLCLTSEFDQFEDRILEDDRHCFVRPFQKFSRTGRLPKGDLQLGSFAYGSEAPHALYSLATSGRAGIQRVVIFPPYGDMRLHQVDPLALIQGNPAVIREGVPIDHVTLGVLPDSMTMHHSHPIRGGKKQRISSTKSYPWPRDEWIGLGSMSVRTPLVLDQAGRVASSHGFLAEGHRGQVTPLGQYLLPGHPVHYLKGPWRQAWHLRVGFYASRIQDGTILGGAPRHLVDDLAFGIYPGAVDGLWTREDRQFYEDHAIQAHHDVYVGDGLCIIVAYGFFPGQPRHSFTWSDSIGHLGRSDWAKMRFWDSCGRIQPG